MIKRAFLALFLASACFALSQAFLMQNGLKALEQPNVKGAKTEGAAKASFVSVPANADLISQNQENDYTYLTIRTSYSKAQLTEFFKIATFEKVRAGGQLEVTEVLNDDNSQTDVYVIKIPL